RRRLPHRSALALGSERMPQDKSRDMAACDPRTACDADHQPPHVHQRLQQDVQMIHYDTIREVHRKMVGGYVSKRFPHHVFSFGWDPDLARKVTSISPKRAEKRIKSYVNYDELDRVYPMAEAKEDFSIRFGVKKTGTGNFGKRKDFCLLGASYSREVLTLYYRKLELFGGLVYDQAIILGVVEK